MEDLKILQAKGSMNKDGTQNILLHLLLTTPSKDESQDKPEKLSANGDHKFQIHEISGFYNTPKTCLNIMQLDEERIVIDFFDTPEAAFDSEAGNCFKTVIINTFTGEITVEADETV